MMALQLKQNLEQAGQVAIALVGLVPGPAAVPTPVCGNTSRGTVVSQLKC